MKTTFQNIAFFVGLVVLSSASPALAFSSDFDLLPTVCVDLRQGKQIPCQSVPGPLGVAGAAAAWGFSRKIRRRIKNR